eukprot:TRINITY_DN25764_c0_g1_i1.p1 TRINITY_DN25764_c0_g1~~TRINITY_DN25764_c0_g1_i1.p1  ORF type:complete len:413 (-),score=70.38 TRINITY_DN25764_c0_g1_i1:114-1262(-)
MALVVAVGADVCCSRGAGGAVAALPVRGPRNIASDDFLAYQQEFGKSVESIEELARRRRIFEANLARIAVHNAEYTQGLHSWWMDVNSLTDLTSDEFRRLRSAFSAPPSVRDSSATEVLSSAIVAVDNPSSVDWRSKEVVSAVNDQGHCGACWAFAAAETLESHYAIASGKLVELSVQPFLSCVSNPNHCGGSGGCGGATVELALNYSAAQGLPLKADLPYLKRADICKPFTKAVVHTGFVKLPENSAMSLETAVATKGPVAVIVAALPWQLYGGGIFQGCSNPLPSLGNELDHAVQVVGYGSENGHKYWLVRNSWGGGWGEEGYIRISRVNDDKTFTDDDPGDGVACKPYPKTQTVGGECGILFDMSYPTGVTAANKMLVV